MTALPLAGPYPGLRPFERQEARLFFGREEEVDQLLDKLGETHFLAVLGLSGSGKSSLVRAGLLPALEGGGLAGAGPRWQVAELRPGDRPFARLAKALRQDTPWGQAGEDEAPALEEKLRRGPQALNWLLGERPPGEGQRLLILVDQFEELFRYPQEAASKILAKADTAAFIALLLATAGHPDSYLVMTLRSEFLGSCGAHPGLAEAINAGLFLTPALTPEQMVDAIQLPIRLPQFGGEVEPELVRELLAQARGIQDPLPLLQHALMRLWDRAVGGQSLGAGLEPAPTSGSGDPSTGVRLTLDDLQTLGGLQQALDAHADQAWQELDEGAEDGPQHRIIETLFRALTERDPSGQDTRRPVRVQAAADLAGVSPAELLTAAEPFRRAGRSFLIPPADQALGPDTSLDISHEALIRQWRRLQNWTADEAKQAELYRRLEAAAQRHANKESALWIDPDLQIALNWRKRQQPTALWARRYGGDFGRAMAFLDAGLAAREATQAEKLAAREAEKQRLEKEATEQRQRAELQKQLADSARRGERRSQRLSIMLAITALIAIVSSIVAWLSKERAQQVEVSRTQHLFESYLTTAIPLTKLEDYAEARRYLEYSTSLDAAIHEIRRHARNLLLGYIEIMGGRADDDIYQGANSALSGGIVISPDGKHIATGGAHGTLVVFDTTTKKILWKKTMLIILMSERRGL